MSLVSHAITTVDLHIKQEIGLWSDMSYSGTSDEGWVTSGPFWLQWDLEMAASLDRYQL